MNERERFNYQEQKQDILSRDSFMCQYKGCMRPAVSLAHRIGKGVYNREWVKNKARQWIGVELTEKQVDIVMHHEKNLVSVCSWQAHNDAFNAAFHKKDAESLLGIIFKDLFARGII